MDISTPPLSPKIYAHAKKAAGYLRAAEKPIRILRTLAWAPEIGQQFLASDGTKMPKVNYARFDAKPSLENIRSARGYCLGDAPVLAWLRRTADTLEQAATMLEQIGTPAFYKISSELYGTPQKTLLDGKSKTINLARHLDATLTAYSFENLTGQAQAQSFGAQEFADRLAEKLAPHFVDNAPKIVLSNTLSAKAVAGRTRIRIRKTARFSPMDVRQLLHHEALVHTATAINGRSQDNFPILAAAHAGTTEIQEGLAVFAEIITGCMDPVRFKRLVNRVIAIQISVEGADFIEVFHYFKEQGSEDMQAYENTRRVFRGGVLSGGAPFTKDGVYLNGLLRVHNYMRTMIKLGRADLIQILFVGKLDLEDVPALASLAAQGALRTPTILPPWAKDMRFLVSYLAYSSFLNEVKLPGFQAYYEGLLADVPDIWQFYKPSSLPAGEES